MSYDIVFVPRRHGQSWDDALDAAEGSDVLTVALGPERREQWGRIVEAMRRRLGEVEVHTADDVLEATHHGTGLQVSLFPDEAALTFPYWDRADTERFHDTVVDLVGVVEHETGLSAWDAQADAPFDGVVHDQEGLAASRRLSEPGASVPGPVAGPAPGTPPGSDGPATASGTGAAAVGRSRGPAVPPGPEAALERTRAQRYLVLGAVIVVAALLWRAQVGPSLLNGLALAVGAADLAIGAVMWRSYRRRREQQP